MLSFQPISDAPFSDIRDPNLVTSAYDTELNGVLALTFPALSHVAGIITNITPEDTELSGSLTLNTMVVGGVLEDTDTFRELDAAFPLPVLTTVSGEIVQFSNNEFDGANLTLPKLTVSANLVSGSLLNGSLPLMKLSKVEASFGLVADLPLPQLTKVSGGLVSGRVLTADLPLQTLNVSGEILQDTLLEGDIPLPILQLDAELITTSILEGSVKLKKLNVAAMLVSGNVLSGSIPLQKFVVNGGAVMIDTNLNGTLPLPMLSVGGYLLTEKEQRSFYNRNTR